MNTLYFWCCWFIFFTESEMPPVPDQKSLEDPNPPSEDSKDSSMANTPKETSTLVFFVNGRKVEEMAPDPATTLLTFLRTKLRLCGTKLGCGEGGVFSVGFS